MKKKKIKINFKYFGPVFNPENNFFTNLLRDMYDVEISNNPDYLFYSVYPDITGEVKDLSKKGDFIKKISPYLYILLRKVYSKFKILITQNKPLVPKGNFVKLFCGSEHNKPNMEECDWAFSTHFEDQMNNARYMRIPLVISNDYQLKDFGIPPLNKKINFNKIKQEKRKFCNFIYSQEIPKRNELFKLINNYKRVDSPGRCMTNMPPIKGNSAKQSRLSYNWVLDKLDFLKEYKFTIAFENFPGSGWVTEKLTHPMLVNSIPIYVGHEDVSKEFNTKSFINYNDFKNMKEFIDFIIKVDNDDKLYEKILNEPWYKEKNLPKDWDINRIKKRFKEIFD
jgi:hypothetical protein